MAKCFKSFEVTVSIGGVYNQFTVDKKYKVDEKLCRACKMCLRSRCPAIKITDKAEINKEKCNGCGICVSLCLTDAIEEIK